MDKNVPLYGVICHGGGLNTIEYRAEINKGRCTSTGRLEYYGPFDHAKYPNLPIIDFTESSWDQLSAALKITDKLRPKEENPLFYQGSLETYLNALKDIGVKILNF